MTDASPVSYPTHVGDVLQALRIVHGAIDSHGFDRTLTHLIWLRASQINGCAYCVDMHTREAREDGETNKRLDYLVVWRRVPDYSEREKAALAWTEALTHPSAEAEYGSLRAELRQHFSDAEISVLTANIAMINLWNRIQISSH